MVKKSNIFLLALALGAVSNLAAQQYKNCNAYEYRRIIREADIFKEKGLYTDAKNNYNAAKVYSCNSENELMAERKVDSLFVQIEQLRQQAESERQKAIKSDSLKNIALLESQNAKLETDNALKKANGLINAFYFYKNNYGLAYKNNQFYFMDTLGNEIEQLKKWDNAEQFNIYTGYAKVKTESYYRYIDTTGIEYKIAYNPTRNSTFQVIEMRDKWWRFSFSFIGGGNFPRKVLMSHMDLRMLIIETCKLNWLPKTIKRQEKLKYINLRENRIHRIPKEIGALTNLIFLDLFKNRIRNLPAEMGDLENLTRLDLGSNRLKIVPTELGNLKNLKWLNLSYNQIETLPQSIGNLKFLQSLNLNHTQLRTLPDEVGNLENLELLDLSDNLVEDLPNNIGNLRKLRYINLTWNKKIDLSDIIEVFKNNPRRILLHSMPISEINLNDYGDLLIINFSNYGNEVPNEIVKLNIVSLQLKWAGISKLPDEISQFKQLKQVILFNNNFENLPIGICSVKNSLIHINMALNKLTSLPPEIKYLNKLERLDLSTNKINRLPPEIGKLYNLRELDLSRNNLSSLPLEIAQLKKLKTLNLQQNPIPTSEHEKIRQLLPDCQISLSN